MELIANASAVRHYLAFLDHIGVDAQRLRVGHMDRRIRGSTAPLKVSARLIVELMETAAEETGRPDLAFDFAEWLNPKGFDAISILWEQSASLREWYELAQRYVHLENNAVHYDIIRYRDEIALTHNILPILKSRSTQFMYSFLALTVRVCRGLLGPEWKPLRVEFSCDRPVDVRAHRRFFRCDLRFGEDRSAVIVDPEDFERKLPHANAELLTYILGHLEKESLQWSANVEDQVAQIILAELAGKAPTLASVADKLAISDRTLQRHLMQRNTSFGAILKAIRAEIVNDRLAKGERIPLAQLAFDLGFADVSAASRFLRMELGLSMRRIHMKAAANAKQGDFEIPGSGAPR